MIDEDGDQASFYSERVVRSRKEHRCGECRRVIAVGEGYQYVFGVWDGRADQHRTCRHCLVAQGWLNRECGGWLFRTIREDLEEHVLNGGVYGGGYGVPLARLVVGMRRGWSRFDGTALMPVPAVPRVTAHG